MILIGKAGTGSRLHAHEVCSVYGGGVLLVLVEISKLQLCIRLVISVQALVA